MTIQIGFLGAGFISDFHAMWLSGAPVEHRIAAVHDPDTERAAGFAARYGATPMTEAEVVERSDALYVTAWTSEHPRLVTLAAEAGKPVLCEKPLGVDGRVAAAMAETVGRAGIINQVGLVLRFLAPCRYVRHLLADPRAGQVLSVVFRDDQFIPVQGQYASTWRVDPDRCGRGAMLEHSIHDIDLLRWWLGPIAKLSASTREYHGHDKIEDVAAVRFDFESGATATLVSLWHDILERPSGRHIEVFCERLHIVIDDEPSGARCAGSSPGSRSSTPVDRSSTVAWPTWATSGTTRPPRSSPPSRTGRPPTPTSPRPCRRTASSMRSTARPRPTVTSSARWNR